MVDIRTVRGGQTEGAAIAGLQYRNAACHGTEIIGDKTKAYELGELEARQQSRERAMQDLGDMFKGEDENDSEEDAYSLMNPGGTEERRLKLRRYSARYSPQPMPTVT